MDCGQRGAKFWLSIMNNLKNRGLEDILIAVVDGLKGFPDAINAAFPDTTVQTCIVHPPLGHCFAIPCRAAGASFPELLRMERSQSRGQKPEANLSGHG